MAPNGFPPSFLQHFWFLLKDDIVAVVREPFMENKILSRINHTFLTLIPQVEDANSVDAFRPISLCNAIYKVISKVAANRLKEVIPDIISKEQNAYVSGRQLQDGVVLIHELIHSLNSKKRQRSSYEAGYD